MDFSSEEDVKVKLVLPYLTALGFQADELHFERSFQLTLGLATHKLDTEKQFTRASGRLDILVTRDNNNLFVVEVKKGHSAFSEADMLQATSYARLVHPVAPFSLLISETGAKLFDSLERKEIRQGEFELKDHYSVSISDERRYEALKFFIGYSAKNVTVFCRQQVDQHMKTLLGSASDRDKQFIPDLYTERTQMHEDFLMFLASPARVFPVVGDSGIGKTCFICATALNAVTEGKPVFFYRAIQFLGEIPKSIADDFNWEFSTEYSGIQVVRRVAELFGSQPLLIFIDAIDEWNLDNKVNILGEFLDHLKGRNVKVIVSCKTNAWPAFLSQRGVPTDIAEILKEPGSDHRELRSMTHNEFFAALERLQQFYNFTGLFESRALEECKRNPFLLRVLFEVAHKCGHRHITLSSVEAFQEFYRRTLEKTGDLERAEKVLKAAAQLMIDKNLDYAELDEVQRVLPFDGTAMIAELLHYNVLENNAGRLSFYFAELKNFVVAYKVLDLEHLKTDQYAFLLERLAGNHAFYDAFKFFYSNAGAEKQAITDGPLRKNAEAYLAFYVEVINRHFPNLNQSFSPFTRGSIGFLGEISLPRKCLTYYGFRALPKDLKETVTFVPTDQVSISDPRPNSSYLHGGEHLHLASSAGGFVKLDVQKEVLNNEIVDQLNHIVERGTLNESQNGHLLIEKVLALAAKHYSKNLGIRDILKLSAVLPLDFAALEYAMRYKIAYRFYEDELVESWRKSGKIKETRIGSHVSYSYSFNDADRRLLAERATDAATRNFIVSKPHVHHADEKMERALAAAIADLRRLGLHAIDETIIPDADRESTSGWVWSNYRTETLAGYVERVYLLFLNEYKTLVETNFPTLKHFFTLYSQMPIKCLITLDRPVIRPRDEDNAPADIYYLTGSVDENSVTFCQHDEIQYDFRTYKLTFQGLEYICRSTMMTGLAHFFSGHRSFADFPIEERLIPLRKLVYGQVKSELPHVIRELLRSYGQVDDPV